MAVINVYKAIQAGKFNHKRHAGRREENEGSEGERGRERERGGDGNTGKDEKRERGPTATLRP